MRLIISVLLFFFFHCVFSQTDTIRWVQKSTIPESISAAQFGYFLIDSDFYVAGGWVGAPGNSFSNQVWRYHIPTNSWHQMRNLPFGGAATSCTFVLNGKGYFLTSIDSGSNSNCDNKFYEYDPINDSWASLSNFPYASRQNSTSFVYDGKGYVGQTFGCGSDDHLFWKYDPIFTHWTSITTLPADIVGGSTAKATLIPNAYLLCGFDHNGNIFNDVWCYNITNNQWDSITQMPGAARAYPVMWSFDSILICGGGEDGINLYNDYYRYNIYNNSWMPIVFQNFPDSVVYSTTFIYDKKAYYFGGPSDLLNSSYNVGIWSFDASKYIHDTTVGIADIKSDVTFSVYLNPTNKEKGLSISTSESGDIIFYDALGRVIDERKLARGVNSIKLTGDNEIVFYRATLQYGATENGKVVFMR